MAAMAKILELQDEVNGRSASSVPNEKQSGGKKDSAKTALNANTSASALAAVEASGEKIYPSGVVFGKDGKPCVHLR